MLSAFLLLLCNSLFLSLHLSGGAGSFPKPLTAQQEREYLRRCAEGDLEARNQLVEHNLRLVAHIIKKYYTQTDDQEDLISIGTIGLIKAVNTFRPDKGIRLATYASRCIENAILSQRNKRRLRWRNGCLLRQNGACWREWESGKDLYPPEHMEKIAQLFEVPVDTLLDDYNLFLRNGQGNQIKAIRTKLGLTQKQYADKLGVSLGNLKHWEQNRKQIFKSTWEKYFKQSLESCG